MPFKHDLSELGRYYKAYEALMAHWKFVLPPEKLLEVEYETLVSNFEEEVRRIISFCDVDWEERCLLFHETERAVKTASAAQVRQPVYQSSIGNSSAYTDMLLPLLDELNRK
jgi:hypothetical protein